MYIDIVLAVADIFKYLYFAAGQDTPAAFEARAGRCKHTCIRYLGSYVRDALPALPADLAQADPLVIVRVDPAKQLVKMKWILRILDILPGKPQFYSIKLEVFLNHFLDPAGDLCAVPGVTFVIEPLFQIVEHISPADFYSFAFCRPEIIECGLGNPDDIIQIQLFFKIFLIIQFDRDYIKIIFIRFRPVNADAGSSDKAPASCVIYLKHISSVIKKSRCL